MTRASFVSSREAKAYHAISGGDLFYEQTTKMWHVEAPGAYGVAVEKTLNRAALKAAPVNCRNCGAPKTRHVCDYCRS